MTKKLEDPADDPVGATRRRLFQTLNAKIGVLGTTLLVGVVVLAARWDDFLAIPIVVWACEQLDELKPLPVASGQRFTIAVAILENDREGLHRRLLREDLSRMDGVELIMVDRRIRMEDATKPQAAQLAGHARARQILRQTHADVLIWGTALDSAVNSPMSLHWTPQSNIEFASSSQAYRPERDLDLPELFWKDLRNALGLLVSTHLTDLRHRQGKFIAEEIPPFIGRVQALLHGAKPAINQTPLRIALADALLLYGEQRANLRLYEEAIEYYREALKDTSREKTPLKWAALMSQLGNAQQELGALAHDTTRLEEARAAFQEAIEAHLRELDALSWAIVQNSLASVLDTLGEYNQDRALLEKAIAIRRETVAVATRDRAPEIWAMIQCNLAASLYILGSLRHDQALLQESILDGRHSLEVLSREREPLHWAAAENTVADALAELGSLSRDTDLLRQSIATFNLVLEEITAQRDPQDWARVQLNLGDTQTSLYQKTANVQWLQYAVGAYRSALTVFRREADLHDWSLAQYSLTRALVNIAIRTKSTPILEEGYSAYVEWLKATDPDKTPDSPSQFCSENTAAALSSIVSALAGLNPTSTPIPRRLTPMPGTLSNR